MERTYIQGFASKVMYHNKNKAFTGEKNMYKPLNQWAHLHATTVDFYVEKNEAGPRLTPYITVNSKWIYTPKYEIL